MKKFILSVAVLANVSIFAASAQEIQPQEAQPQDVQSTQTEQVVEAQPTSIPSDTTTVAEPTPETPAPDASK